VILAIPYNTRLRLFLGYPTLVGKALSFTHKLFIYLFLFFLYQPIIYTCNTHAEISTTIYRISDNVTIVHLITKCHNTVRALWHKNLWQKTSSELFISSPNSTRVKAGKLMAGCGLLYITACKLNTGSRSEHSIGMSQG